MRIEFAPTRARYERYPWDQMQDIGDYFDVPTPGRKRAEAISSAALARSRRHPEVYRCVSLADGSLRVMLVDFATDPAAASEPALELPPTLRPTL